MAAKSSYVSGALVRMRWRDDRRPPPGLHILLGIDRSDALSSYASLMAPEGHVWQMRLHRLVSDCEVVSDPG